METEAVVTRSWVGSDFHDVTWNSARLDSSPLQRSGVHEVTMPSGAGEYGYYCTIHRSGRPAWRSLSTKRKRIRERAHGPEPRRGDSRASGYRALADRRLASPPSKEGGQSPSP